MNRTLSYFLRKLSALRFGNEAVDDGTGLAGLRAAEEEEVLFADSGWANGVLDEVVVDFKRAMFKVKIECIPTFEGIVDGFAEVALR